MTDQLAWKERNKINFRKALLYTFTYQIMSTEFNSLIAPTSYELEALQILEEYLKLIISTYVKQSLEDFFKIEYLPDKNLGASLCRVKKAVKYLCEVGHTPQPLYMRYHMIQRCLGISNPVISEVCFTEEKITET